MNILVFNPSVLKFQILLFLVTLYAFIDLQDSHQISFKNFRIYWKILHSEFFIFGDFNLQLETPTTATTTFGDTLTSTCHFLYTHSWPLL